LERILAQHFEEAISFVSKACRCVFLRVLLRLFGKDELPLHQGSSFAHFPMGVASPLRMDCLMRGMDSR
jgi:hypothetical protein